MMLSGRKLRGRWALVRLKNDPKAWLLFKKRDPYAIPGVTKEDDVTRLESSSVTRIHPLWRHTHWPTVSLQVVPAVVQSASAAQAVGV